MLGGFLFIICIYIGLKLIENFDENNFNLNEHELKLFRKINDWPKVVEKLNSNEFQALRVAQFKV